MLAGQAAFCIQVMAWCITGYCTGTDETQTEDDIKNQSIQFPDRANRGMMIGECIVFPVMINGFLSDCRVSAIPCSPVTERSQKDMLVLFRRNRWDLEEEFAEFIEKGEADEPPYRLPCDR